MMPTSPRVWIKKSKKNRNPPPQLIIVVSHVSPCVLPDPALVKQASGPHPQQGKEALFISVKSTNICLGFSLGGGGCCCFFFNFGDEIKISCEKGKDNHFYISLTIQLNRSHCKLMSHKEKKNKFHHHQ